MKIETIAIKTPVCPRCATRSTVVLPVAAYEAWRDGLAIQKAWPEGSSADRELLITGYHDACFNAHFPPDPEE